MNQIDTVFKGLFITLELEPKKNKTTTKNKAIKTHKITLKIGICYQFTLNKIR
jgi:hypothetical protein